ncbi:MAG: alpha-L-fucosidase [Rikenellaceae bacterium]|jgi:alpha-L-fucosidase|nr:alpha-L-fucosidase [Rikenellaceae bacterium]
MKKLSLLAGALLVCAAPLFAQTADLPVYQGKYRPSDESLKTYSYPAWFRDAKFGVWAHWGPQAVPRQGDWYARKMYQADNYDCAKNRYNKAHPDYIYHAKNYGHPSEVGYKDIIPLWTAERWNPEELMKLYKRVGARYFVSMATHHDNFFLWNSKLQDGLPMRSNRCPWSHSCLRIVGTKPAARSDIKLATKPAAKPCTKFTRFPAVL